MKGELGNEIVNYVQKLKHMYQFEPEVEVIKKGSPDEIWTGFRSCHSQIFLKIGVLKNLADSTGNSCVGVTCVGVILKALLKRDSNTAVLQWNLQNF